MQIQKQAVLLRIFIGEDDKFGGSPLYEAIVLKAREVHFAGAPGGWSPPKPPVWLMTPATRSREQENGMCDHRLSTLTGSPLSKKKQHEHSDARRERSSRSHDC